MVGQVDLFEIVGKRIDAKYEILEVVDETTFSVVYRATHVVWKRDVAIKAFKIAGHLTEEARSGLLASFLREGALLAELSERCTAICQARDVASFTTASGQWVPYMVLEWVDGEPLEVVLERERRQGATPRTVQGAVALLAPIAEALAVAHGRGIVHCDVKPGNILLLRDTQERSHSKLLDFGLAKVLRDSRVDAIVQGSFTPAYAAPEQWSSEHGTQGPATDVFALALILVELVTGREAFQADNLDDLARASCDPRLRPTPRARGVAVGDEVERVLARALALDPASRFADAQEFWEALEAAIAAGSGKVAERAKGSLAPDAGTAAALTPPWEADVVIPLCRRRPRRSPAATATFAACACAALGWHVSSQSVGHDAWPVFLASSSAALASGAEWMTALTSAAPTSAPIFAAICIVANTLCIGTLFSVSWLCRRGPMMADGPEIGRLATQLFRRWTVPSLVVTLVAAAAWCNTAIAREPLQDRWLYGIALATLALVCVNVRVGRRANRLAHSG